MSYKVLFKNDVIDVLRVIEDNVVWYFKGCEEIGSSDFGACYRAILREFGVEYDDVEPREREMLVNAMHNSMHLAQED